MVHDEHDGDHCFPMRSKIHEHCHDLHRTPSRIQSLEERMRTMKMSLDGLLRGNELEAVEEEEEEQSLLRLLR